MDTCNCRFCQIASGEINQDYDKPLTKEDNYFTLASVGTFIQGWSLVVPAKHEYSMRNFYTDPGFLRFLNSWIARLKKQFGNIIVFEHGANHYGSVTSCGTNHCHLHTVPLNKSLLNRITSDRTWTITTFSHVKELVGNKEYLLYSEINDTAENSVVYVSILENEESQYFRRILASELGVDDYSYKSSPRYEETISSFYALKRTE